MSVQMFDMAAERDRKLLRKAMDLLERAESILENSSVRSGVCCCGDDMRMHPSPLSCGHSPVDSAAYTADGFIDDLIKFRAVLSSQ